MPTLKSINLSSHQAAVVIICLLEVTFLGMLVFAYRANGNADLRMIMKDVFLGWNTALALALNAGGFKTVQSGDTSTTITSTTPAPEIVTNPPAITVITQDPSEVKKD